MSQQHNTHQQKDPRVPDTLAQPPPTGPREVAQAPPTLGVAVVVVVGDVQRGLVHKVWWSMEAHRHKTKGVTTGVSGVAALPCVAQGTHLLDDYNRI
jgi:hypothetical protein